HRARAHALLGGIAEQLERQPLGVATHVLLHRRIESRNRHLPERYLLVERKLGGVVLDVDLLRLAVTILPLHVDDRFLGLRHQLSPPQPQPASTFVSLRARRSRSFCSSSAASTAVTIRPRTVGV